jgi:hypothetical protein
MAEQLKFRQYERPAKVSIGLVCVGIKKDHSFCGARFCGPYQAVQFKAHVREQHPNDTLLMDLTSGCDDPWNLAKVH